MHVCQIKLISVQLIQDIDIAWYIIIMLKQIVEQLKILKVKDNLVTQNKKIWSKR